MTNMHNLFFELLQIALGTRQKLSFIPQEEEWQEAYDVSCKQTLAGIGFKGTQEASNHDVAVVVNLPLQLKMQWLALAVNIEKHNEMMNQRCSELYKMLKKDGYDSCVLKGQAVARLYDQPCEKLGALRQSGDIDIWMMEDADSAIQWAKRTGTMYYFDYHHADLKLFDNVETELHYRPSISRNLWRNIRLQRWFKGEGKKHIGYDQRLGFCVPDDVFSLVLTLNHNLWHLLYEGVGLRQMMDLYFVARVSQPSDEKSRLLRHFGLGRFAAASAWVLWQVFDGGKMDSFLISARSPLPKPDERGGRFLLHEIMLAGNFGHYDERLKGNRYASSHRLLSQWLRHVTRLCRYYPLEALWTPFGIIYISLWRRWKKAVKGMN